MAAGPYAAFILAAYAAGVVVVAGLVAWVTLDYRSQLRELAELERRGAVRRSAAADLADPPSQER